MRVTVAICTWNRCDLLRQTLDEMVKLSIPRDVTWELLVVNNNCTDDTDGVIASFASTLPIRRLFETKPGQSNARNLAIREATGSYLVWTDDDTLVAPDWLEEYCAAFVKWPEAAVFGGLVEPWFPNTPPSWLSRAWHKVAAAYATVDHGPALLPLTQHRMPFGANMAMRMDYQRANLFDPDRGLRPGSHMRGDETDVIGRILEAGGAGFWLPTARLRHYVPTHRQTIRYIRDYYAGLGEYLARFSPDTESKRLFGQPRWLWKAIAVKEARYRLGRLFSSPDVWMDDLIAASKARGSLRVPPPPPEHRSRPD